MNALSEKSEREGGVNIDLNSLPKAKYPLVYIKENGKKYSFKTIDGDSYKFSDEIKMTWKVLKESKKIKTGIVKSRNRIFRKKMDSMVYYRSFIP